MDWVLAWDMSQNQNGISSRFSSQNSSQILANWIATLGRIFQWWAFQKTRNLPPIQSISHFLGAGGHKECSRGQKCQSKTKLRRRNPDLRTLRPQERKLIWVFFGFLKPSPLKNPPLGGFEISSSCRFPIQGLLALWSELVLCQAAGRLPDNSCNIYVIYTQYVL